MAVAVTEFIDPEGPLAREMFPRDASQEIFEARIEGYITSGQTKSSAAADQDAAVRAFVYWKAYENIYARLSTSAATETIPEDESSTYTADQRAAVKRARDEYRAEFEALVKTQPTTTSVERQDSTHRAVVIQW